ncbi:hypothetical protein [Alkalicoccus daliensis]|uniref:Carboxypeptidase regulatory-like domain-containing protein n=1 Tax=Alkalicoccus daliensis TaxID=745820 RepID=A0A1H0GH28_9BACI|nr:hypothetical protein [Alkalicoccus daliensis]SDO06245.1 hypothetical protein SAMN04488053_106108 [Alkalicoccus daliensis]
MTEMEHYYEMAVNENEAGGKFAIGFVLQEPSANQQVIIKDENNRVVQHGATDEFGYFQLALPKTVKEVTLEIRSLQQSAIV